MTYAKRSALTYAALELAAAALQPHTLSPNVQGYHTLSLSV